jgi:hypothetical protein
VKRSHKAWRKQITASMKFGPMANARRLLRERHLVDHPNCTYEGPHFVPPSFGDVGFYLCDVPADIRRPAITVDDYPLDD